MNPTSVPSEQLALLRRTVRATKQPTVTSAAPERAVARVAVDLPLAHLDRPFDYLVPAAMHEDAVPGCRVKVRFAGRDVSGFVLDRVEASQHEGTLAPLRRVVSAEQVLSPEVLTLVRMVADHYAGTWADVVRLAIPPRHARVEQEERRERQPPLGAPLDAAQSRWSVETGGRAFLDRLAAGQSPRAVWSALPGADWPAQLAAVAAATLASGRGSILCAPDARDVARVSAAVSELLGPDAHVVLTAELGPAARYRAFLALSRGLAQIVVGTRAAAFAPVRDLGLVAIWDDGDDLYAEPRAPYPHAREVLLLRAHHEQTAALVSGLTRSVEGQLLVETGWAASLTADRVTARSAAPQVHVTGESDREHERDQAAASARVPRRVFDVVREALATGPVLVHHPRGGYQPALTCDSCRRSARCLVCAGALTRPRRGASPRCAWCGTEARDWSCPHCSGRQMRSPVVGAARTAEEWGRGFPGTLIVASGKDHVVDRVGTEPAIVIATPGAEPRAERGYAAAVLLDTWLTLGRPELRAGEEALRRWLNVCALVRAGRDGGRVIAVGQPDLPELQALVRWDPEGYAARELADRQSAHLTPATRMATITGARGLVDEVSAALDLPSYVEQFGPVDLADGQARLVVRTSRQRGGGLSRALHQLQAGRSTRKRPPVRIQIDPPLLL